MYFLHLLQLWGKNQLETACRFLNEQFVISLGPKFTCVLDDGSAFSKNKLSVCLHIAGPPKRLFRLFFNPLKFLSLYCWDSSVTFLQLHGFVEVVYFTSGFVLLKTVRTCCV